jgi:hypothetical protein
MLQHNTAGQNLGLIAWTGAASIPREIVHHLYNSFVLETVGALAADAIFDIVAYDGTVADPCTVDIATERPVMVKPHCDYNAVATEGQVTIPAGTPVGTVITGTLACKPARFIALKHVSGGANVRAVIVLSGPTR